MHKNLTKTAIILVFSFFILVGCQQLAQITQPVQQTADYLSGTVQIEQKKQADKSLATIKCQELCQVELAAGEEDFLVGPCLNEKIIPDWSCDIVHSPRQEVDEDPANQCANFRTGATHHFVEVDGNCNLVKVY